MPQNIVIKKKIKHAVEIVSPSGEVQELAAVKTEIEEPPHIVAQRLKERKVANKLLRCKSYRAVVPHLARADTNKRLRRIATKGGMQKEGRKILVTLFNAVANIQKNFKNVGEVVETAAEKKQETGPKKMAESMFLDILKKGTASNYVKQQGIKDKLAKEQEQAKKKPKLK